MIASYEGIGPIFKIKLELLNESKEPIKDVNVVLNFDETVYKMRRSNYPHLPLILPKLTYHVDIEVECIEPMGAADSIKVCVFNPESGLPLISATIQMPVCE